MSFFNHFLNLFIFGKQFCLVLKCDLLALCKSELRIDLEEILFVTDSLSDFNYLKENLFRFPEFGEAKVGFSHALHGLED